MTEVTDSLRAHYKAAYGAWAGFPRGNQPDYACCCANLHNSYHPGGYQCTRKRGFGPDGAYCKQHDPAAVKARNEASAAKYRKGRHREEIQYAGPKFLAVLEQIADGHNDPRSLAQEVIAPYIKDESL